MTALEEFQVLVNIAKARRDASKSAVALNAVIDRYNSERWQSFTNSKVYYSQSE